MTSFEEALGAVLPDEIRSVAARLGVSERTIRSWVRGERRTDPSQVFALEGVLGVEPGGLSRHLGYLPLSAEEGRADRVARARASLAAEIAPLYDGIAGDVARGPLLDGADLERAAAAGLRSELLRLVIDDIEREHGPVAPAAVARMDAIYERAAETAASARL